MDFYDFDFEDDILDAIDSMNFVECTPIQEKALPPLMEGRDLIGVAQTGTGKTAAYLLPVLNSLSKGGHSSDAINCVIMAPTRELAQQIDRQLEGFTYFTSVSSVAVYGGNDGARYEQERKGMAKGADILVATPGRLISHISLGNVDLSKVSFFILDEADRMLDMGFYDDIMVIAKQLPPNRQTMLFSATMPNEIRRLASNILNNPFQITLSLAKPADKIVQQSYICHEHQKLGIIKNIFANESSERVIVFISKKVKVKDLVIAFKRLGMNVGAMHSDLTQLERDEIMFKFKSRKIDMLIATDILARGIDIDDIRIVINYDVPRDCDDYIHRVGRTARANNDGRAITFVAVDDQFYFSKIENFIGKEIERLPIGEELGEIPEYSPVLNRRRKPDAKNRKPQTASHTKEHNRTKNRDVKNRRSDFFDSSSKPVNGKYHNRDFTTKQKRDVNKDVGSDKINE